MRNPNKMRIFRQEIKKIMPKKVRVAGGFCKYGRVYSNPGTSTKIDSVFVVPIEGNQNNVWRV